MEKILVIEDNKVIRENIIDLLESNDLITFNAINGVDGLSLAKKELPDLILCDIMMPGIDGYEVKEKLKKNQKTALIPFIFLTAKAELKEIRKGMIIGADDYIVKPYDSIELIDSIKARLEKHREIIQLSNSKSDNENRADESNKKKKNKVLVNINNEQRLIDFSKIVYIESCGNYSNVMNTNSEKLMIRKLMGEWENVLSESDFLRIHQSTIININYIEKFEKLAKRTYIVRLKDIENPFTVSVRYSAKIKKLFQF